MASKNIFSINGNEITIFNKRWDKIATATIRSDYIDEIQSVTWSKNGEYLYNKEHGYLHIYIMKKWYGEVLYASMKENDYIIDHMDNEGFNCSISNLCFLTSDENKAKGLTLDKMSREKCHIALSLYKDFHTQLMQITIVFNYPAVAKIRELEASAVIELAYLLYNSPDELVINDARMILYEYKNDYSFSPENLHDVDYHIEGTYGTLVPIEVYDEYITGNHGHAVCFFKRKSPLKEWTLETKRKFFHLRGEPTKHM
jgi:hypothetical protein